MEAFSIDLERPFRYLADIVQNLAKLHVEETTRLIKESLIGSQITGIEMNPIPQRKTMSELIIRTNAKPIKIPKVVTSEFYQPEAYLDCSEIKVRVKMRR